MNIHDTANAIRAAKKQRACKWLEPRVERAMARLADRVASGKEPKVTIRIPYRIQVLFGDERFDMRRNKNALQMAKDMVLDRDKDMTFSFLEKDTTDYLVIHA